MRTSAAPSNFHHSSAYESFRAQRRNLASCNPGSSAIRLASSYTIVPLGHFNLLPFSFSLLPWFPVIRPASSYTIATRRHFTLPPSSFSLLPWSFLRYACPKAGVAKESRKPLSLTPCVRFKRHARGLSDSADHHPPLLHQRYLRKILFLDTVRKEDVLLVVQRGADVEA